MVQPVHIKLYVCIQNITPYLLYIANSPGWTPPLTLENILPGLADRVHGFNDRTVGVLAVLCINVMILQPGVVYLISKTTVGDIKWSNSRRVE